jgi:hypothetical protein
VETPEGGSKSPHSRTRFLSARVGLVVIGLPAIVIAQGLGDGATEATAVVGHVMRVAVKGWTWREGGWPSLGLLRNHGGNSRRSEELELLCPLP